MSIRGPPLSSSSLGSSPYPTTARLSETVAVKESKNIRPFSFFGGGWRDRRERLFIAIDTHHPHELQIFGRCGGATRRWRLRGKEVVGSVLLTYTIRKQESKGVEVARLICKTAHQPKPSGGGVFFACFRSQHYSYE